MARRDFLMKFISAETFMDQANLSTLGIESVNHWRFWRTSSTEGSWQYGQTNESLKRIPMATLIRWLPRKVRAFRCLAQALAASTGVLQSGQSARAARMH